MSLLNLRNDRTNAGGVADADIIDITTRWAAGQWNALVNALQSAAAGIAPEFIDTNDYRIGGTTVMNGTATAPLLTFDDAVAAPSSRHQMTLSEETLDFTNPNGELVVHFSIEDDSFRFTVVEDDALGGAKFTMDANSWDLLDTLETTRTLLRNSTTAAQHGLFITYPGSTEQTQYTRDYVKIQSLQVLGAQGAAITALTDSTGGTPGGTLAAVSGSGDDATINSNLASLAAQVELILARMRASTGHGLIA